VIGERLNAAVTTNCISRRRRFLSAGSARQGLRGGVAAMRKPKSAVDHNVAVFVPTAKRSLFELLSGFCPNRQTTTFRVIERFMIGITFRLLF
jgi:hypothetical protein